MPRWVIGGTVGGVIGIIIWVIAVMTGPSGLLWGVLGLGLSVGIGVRVATGRCGEACDLPHAAVAVCIVTVSMILAKVLVFGVLVLSIDHEEIERLRAESRTDDQAMISLQANRILTERAQRGEDVDLSAYPAAASVRQVRLSIQSNYQGTTGGSGLNEVRLYGYPPPAPPAGTVISIK